VVSTPAFGQDISRQIIDRAEAAWVSLAGIVSTSALRTSPAHGAHSAPGTGEWLPEGCSALVLALAHAEAEPALDWWGVEGGTAGNQRLIEISQKLRTTLVAEVGIEAQLVPYHPGLYLKDAAVLAGMGTLGDNNLLVTPAYGPRVRLRALLLQGNLAPTGPVAFSPCQGCDHPCWSACPQGAFASGRYDRARCQRQMAEDERSPVVRDASSREQPISVVKYCRACELACPVGTDRV
jgi:epoxyqueuosine reductase